MTRSAHEIPSHEPKGPEKSVLIFLPGCPDCDLTCDPIAAQPGGGDTYRILEVPTDSAALGIGDLVLALESDSVLEFVAVIERRCLASISFHLAGWIDQERFLQRLTDTQVEFTEVSMRVFMCNAASQQQVHALCDLLQEFRVNAQLCDHVMQHWHALSA
ncbi:MAG: hypothetical protein WCJ04_11615 [Actinomycetes bacterium]